MSIAHRVIRSVGSDRLRRLIMRKLGVSIGEGTVVRSGVELNLPRVEIGKNVFINYRCQLNTGWGGDARIIIGDNVRIAMDVALICVSHEMGDTHRRAAADTYKDIVIGEGAWIGARSTVLQGVRIGEGTIIGAGSLVNRDCEPNCLYAGVPARLIKRLD